MLRGARFPDQSNRFGSVAMVDLQRSGRENPIDRQRTGAFFRQRRFELRYLAAFEFREAYLELVHGSDRRIRASKHRLLVLPDGFPRASAQAESP